MMNQGVNAETLATVDPSSLEVVCQLFHFIIFIYLFIFLFNIIISLNRSL